MNLFSNYNGLMNFVERNYYVNPAYALGNTVFLQEEYRQYIILWHAWYYGLDDDFHRYTIYNGTEEVRRERKSLQMAKKLCEDKADLLLNEKVQITVDESTQQMIDDVLHANKFRSRANELIEKTSALGTGAFVEFIDRGKIKIDYLTVDKVIPITIENGEIIDCAFASISRYKNSDTVYLNTHIKVYPVDPSVDSEEAIEKRMEMGIPLDYEGYIIENKILKNHSGRFESFDEAMPEEMKDVVLTYSSIPRFQIIKPAKANNIAFEDNGLGLSVYSNAIQDLRGCDLVYDSFLNEFELGKKRIFVHDSLAQIEVDRNGADTILKPMFDTNDTVFYSIDMEGDEEKIKVVDPTLRIEEHDKGLNRQLNTLGFKCGFGNDYYKFEGGVVKTATEVMSNNNPLFKSVKKDQHILREALTNMAKSIIDLSNTHLKTSYDVNQDISVDFDDSIFEDTEAIRKNALLELNSGIIDNVEYFMTVYKLTKEQAIAKVAEIDKRMPKEEEEIIGDDE